jgi:hypothetical protein
VKVDAATLKVEQGVRVVLGKSPVPATIKEVTRMTYRFIADRHDVAGQVRASGSLRRRMLKHGVIRFSLVACSLALAGLAQAIEPVLKESDLPVLAQESQHATASKRIANLFTAPYKQFKLDDAFSSVIFDKYLENLDYSRNLFLASDISRLRNIVPVLTPTSSEGDWLRPTRCST